MISSIPSPNTKLKKSGVLRVRENNFVLDCVNPIKSKIEGYNPVKDKYLKYILQCPCLDTESYSNIKQCKSYDPLQQNLKDFVEMKKENFLRGRSLHRKIEPKNNFSQKENLKAPHTSLHSSSSPKYRKKVYRKKNQTLNIKIRDP